MKSLLLAAVLVALASPAAAADKVKVYIVAEPDAALGGLVSAGLVDSANDLKTLLKRRGVFQTVQPTDTRTEAAILVSVTKRHVVDEEYRVHVTVTSPDGKTRELVGSNTRQWNKCMEPIAAALDELAKAQQTATR